MRASSVSLLRSVWAVDLLPLSVSSPRICLMSACQGVVVACALPSALPSASGGARCPPGPP
eukprot:3273591-Pyramimonas_sp.AAC.1